MHYWQLDQKNKQQLSLIFLIVYFFNKFILLSLLQIDTSVCLPISQKILMIVRISSYFEATLEIHTFKCYIRNCIIVMQEGTKSTLVLGQQPKKQFTVEQISGQQIEYKQMVSSGEYCGELSDEQKEAQFNRIHDQYIKMKINRKKELMKLKKEEFGTSSSDQQEGSSQQQIGQPQMGKKIEVKKSKGKSSQKSSFTAQQNRYSVVLQLKKIISQTQLVILEKEFEINKKVIPIIRINKLSICLGETGNKNARRFKIGIGSDDDVVVSCPQSLQNKSKDKIIDLFMRFLRIKLNLKPLKTTQQPKVKIEEFGQLSEGAFICDKLFKKSQIIGTWNDGVHSYRTLKSKATMFIPINQIKQVQTQFEFYKEQLVCKLVYGNNIKTDFGLPLDSKLQWVLQFANLVRE